MRNTVLAILALALALAAPALPADDLEDLVNRLINERLSEHRPQLCAWVGWQEHETKKETHTLRCPAGTMMTELDLRVVDVHGDPYVVGQALCCDSFIVPDPDWSAPRVGTIEELLKLLESRRSNRER